ncbi:acetyl-CoA carboxylase biotin carboxyl carrier protein [Pullulanibacillus pueri]|uniref:Biotin carboxyl carrier protein of acetyl-CoA carboxylase n=1 Tax=Pullulanibacillus pueri TaxID=1437324 RepID=A0A8J2ZV23_9BACL|nr:acetyl-CoA carboxylase biotin carboxyl carrier protein [Pullulanibacillus pueri]MBM7681592.1 acetyl-CoA carboxylase biotin carboxyl carrier protein [Pullulanibacillus pueri]GGH79542.1 biotin carboxyl carrier protein of acetyl-CoA carboxylase [Pullulanibacillus pueri]
MLKVEELKELIQLIDDSSIDEFEYEVENSKVVLKKNKEVVVTTVAEPVVQHVAPQSPAQPTQVSQSTQKPVDNNAQEDLNTDSNLHKIESPMVGTFYAKPSPEKENFVKKGSKVDADSVVCIIEAMKLFNEIEADVKGEIVEVLVEDGQLVEYGQPLFLVKAE